MKLLQYMWKSSILKIFNSKMAIFLAVMLVTSRTYLNPIREFSKAMEYPASWCVFPFVMCSFSYLILFWFGVIYVNTDVPFMQHVNMYHTIRAGRKGWALGQIGGIMLRSFVMVILTAACTILPLLPGVEWTNEWGKLFYTMANTPGVVHGNFVFIYYGILAEYTPLALMGLEILVCTLICTLVGVLMFLLSLYINKICAVAGSLALAIALFPVLNLHPLLRHKLARFIPTVWAELARIATPDYTYYWLPSLSYMLVFLGTGILLMTAVILIKIKRIQFNWENEDM